MPKKNRSANWLILSRLALVAFLTLAIQAADIAIFLRNGDRVTGEIVSETATEVTLRSGALGKISVPVGEILKRELVAPKAASSPSGTNKVVAANPPAGVTNSAKAKPPVVPPKHWNTEVQLGLNLRYSTIDQHEALVVAKSTYSRGRFREILDYNFARGDTEGVLSANRMGGSSKTEWDIKPKVYAFGLAGAGYDQIRQIDRSFEVNPGIGYQWIKKPEFVFKTEVGMGYQDQFFSDGHEVNAYSGRLAGIFTWRIWDKLLADGRAEYFPNVQEVNEYRLRFESTLRYPLLKNLSLNLIVVDLYDTQAPRGVENNDLQIRSAIGVKF